jgi:exonuclease SbcD
MNFEAPLSSMKILHTADWHLGKKLNGFSRHPEQVLVLNEICQLADEHCVDLVLIAGDLFDGPNPSSESTELFYKTLRRLSADGKRAVVAIAGNHDSPDRIAAPEPLALACGIVLLGYPDTVVPPFETENGIRLLQSQPGFLELALPGIEFPVRLILTPFANEVRLKKYLGSEDSSLEMRNLLAETWKNLAGEKCDDKGVNLLMTHQYFIPSSGEIEPESDDERSIAGLGGTDALPVSILPDGIQYVALGHIHKFWKVASKPCPVVYSSSPLCYSLNEAGQEKYVVLLEAKPASEVDYRKIALKEGRPVLRKTFESVDEALVWLDQNPDALVELTLVSDEFLKSEDSRRIHAAHEGILDIVPQLRNRTFSMGSEAAEVADPELDKMTLFTSFFKQKKGQEPSEELKELFHEILHS